MAGITALIGLPGHGKSYSAVELILIPALELRDSRPIYTNLPLVLDEIAAVYPESNIITFDIAEIKQDAAFFDGHLPGALFIIDELWRLFPAGVKVDAIPTYHLAFIKEHRHRANEAGQSTDLVFVTQTLDDITASIRAMVQLTIVTVQLLDVGKTNRFRRDYYRGVVKGFEGLQKQFIKNEYGSYSPPVYRFYKTHMNADSNALVSDQSAIGDSSIFTSWKAKAAAFLFLFFLLSFAYGAYRTSSNLEKMTTDAPKPAKPSSPTKPVRLAKADPPPQALPLSKRWRITGHARDGNKVVTVLVSDGFITRHVIPAHCSFHFDLSCRFEGETVTQYSGAPPEPSPSVAYAISPPIATGQ